MKSNDILNLIEKVQVGMNECKEAVKKTKEMSISKKEHNNTMRQLQTEKKEAENQIKISEDRLDHLSKTKSLKDAAATHALNEAVSDLDILKQKKIEMKQTFEKRKDEIELLKTKLSNLKIQGKENIEKRRLALKRLDNIAESSSETLMERIAISGV